MNQPAERVVTVPTKMAQSWRVAMFALTELFLKHHRAMSGHGRLSPIELLIYITVSNGNVQKLMRERAIPEELAAQAVLPREWVVPLSRNAIASATGLPRETVRRQVANMIVKGWFIEDPRGGVTLPVGAIASHDLGPLLESLLTEFARSTETLLRCGVIEVQRPSNRATGDAF